MSRLFLPLLVVAGAVLGWIAFRTDDPTYRAPAPEVVGGVVPFEISGEIPAGMVVRHFEVTGMCCEGCEGKLYRALKGAPGVERAAVDFLTGSAQALVAEGASPDPLATVLTFDKYEARPLAAGTSPATSPGTP